MLAGIIVFCVAFFIIVAVVVATVIVIARKKPEEKKDERPPKERCTIRVTGVLVYVHQQRDHFSPSEHEEYWYYPVVRYEYNGQAYETEYKHSSGLWNLVEKESSLEVFVNPEDANDIYVPVPEAAVEKDRKRRKTIIICFIVYFIIAGSIELIKKFLM